MADTVKSLFGDMFRTPEEIRQAQMQDLQKQGLLNAQSIRQNAPQGRNSGLAQAIAGHAAGIAQYIPTTGESMRRGLLGGAGMAAGMAGQEQLQQGFQQAAMGTEEAQAQATQDIMRGADMSSVEGLKAAQEKFRAAGNARGVAALQSKIDAAQAAQAKAKMEERKVAATEGTLRVSQDRLAFEKKKQDNPTQFTTVTGDKAAAKGLNPNAVYSVNESTNEYKELYTPSSKEAGFKDARWAENENGETFLAGTVNGKLVRMTDEGAVPLSGPIKPVKQVTKVESLTDAMSQLQTNLDKRIAKLDDGIEVAGEIRLAIEEARTNPKALPQLARLLPQLSGKDRNLAVKEIELIMGGGSIVTRVADALTKGVDGVLTTQSYDDILAFVDKLTTYRENKKVSEIGNWYDMYKQSEDSVIQEAAKIVSDGAMELSDNELVNKYVEEAKKLEGVK